MAVQEAVLQRTGRKLLLLQIGSPSITSSNVGSRTSVSLEGPSGSAAGKVSEHQPWDVVSWGDMDAATCGHRTLEALMGLFALRHPACPKHFWCKPDHLRLVAQCYTAYAHQDARRRIYVGVYTWPVLDLNPTTIRLLDGTDVPGVDAVSADEPLMKIQLFPMPDGSIRGDLRVHKDDCQGWFIWRLGRHRLGYGRDSVLRVPGASETCRHLPIHSGGRQRTRSPAT